YCEDNDITVIVFFFQAEDGIRDFHVTGVQTCALPIFHTIVALQDCDITTIRFKDIAREIYIKGSAYSTVKLRNPRRRITRLCYDNETPYRAIGRNDPLGNPMVPRTPNRAARLKCVPYFFTYRRLHEVVLNMRLQG